MNHNEKEKMIVLLLFFSFNLQAAFLQNSFRKLPTDQEKQIQNIKDVLLKNGKNQLLDDKIQDIITEPQVSEAWKRIDLEVQEDQAVEQAANVFLDTFKPWGVELEERYNILEQYIEKNKLNKRQIVNLKEKLLRLKSFIDEEKNDDINEIRYFLEKYKEKLKNS